SSVAQPNMTVSAEDCGVCWKLLFSLCPAVFILSTFFSLVFSSLLCWKTAEMPHDKEKKCDFLRPTEKTKEIHRVFQKQKKTQKEIYSSDFSMFTAVMYNLKVED
ncbi:hypothetical protein AMECASPLE_034426, partial [Ameca splendens]